MQEISQQQRMTSLEIAELTDKRHSDVLEAIAQHGASMGKSSPTEISARLLQGQKQQAKAVLLPW